MSAKAATWRLGRHAMRIGILGAVISIAAAASSGCMAEETGSAPAPTAPATAEACKGPSSTNHLVSGFSLMCGKRIPTGAFLGAFMSPGPDSLGDCIKRCTANARCRAFTLDGRERTEGRVCTLLGSHEAVTDEASWVSGVRTAHSAAFSHAIDPGGNLANVSGTVSPNIVAKLAPPPHAPVAIDGGDDPHMTLTGDIKALQPVYYATDRRPAATDAPLEVSFTGERSMSMSYGLSIVSIPKHHTIGNVERPKFRILRLSREAETDADHFRIKAMTPLDHDGFVSEIKGGAGSVLLFIHGYNVTFADAVFRAAQIAFDANFAGTVVSFSWPSAGELVAYDRDRESAEFAVPHLAAMFELLSKDVGKKNVYIVAHSMGNQVLVNALVQSALSKANLTVTELVMAAPDVDTSVFASKAEEIRSVASNITVYASAADKALLASGKKSFGTRLGFVGASGPNIFPGLEVIDVTAVGDDMFGLDHGTFASSRVVLDDLAHLIRSVTHLKPDMRTPELREMPDQAHVTYWLYPE